jgi:hypothetical protein
VPLKATSDRAHREASRPRRAASPLQFSCSRRFDDWKSGAKKQRRFQIQIQRTTASLLKNRRVAVNWMEEGK